MMKLKIYVFRHAQTHYNKEHRFTGWKDSELTPLGIEQAKRLALKLKKKKIDIAYQTNLSRSKDTLKEVLKYHPECKRVITDDRIIERSYGRLQGKSHQEFVKIAGEEDYKTMLHWHKIDLLTGKEKKVNVAISAHGNSMRPFRRHFEKLSIAKMMKLENPWDDYFEYTMKG